MHSSKLFQIITSLSKVELNQLNKIVNSPVFNQNKYVLIAFDFIEKIYPKFTAENCSKEKLFKHVYPNETYNDEKVRNLMSDLSQLIEEYFILIELDKNTFIKKHFLVEAYKSRNLDKYYQWSLGNLGKSQKSSSYRDVNFYFQQHILEEENHEYTLLTRNRSIGTSLQQLVDNLDFYYLAKKLKYTCEIINRKNVLAEEYKLVLVQEILEYLDKNSNENVPIIQIYYQVLLTLDDSTNENHYNKLIELLEKYSSIFPNNENKALYGFASNYCIKKINSGKSEYLLKLFNLYQLSIINKVIFENNKISQWDFKNIITVALRLNKIEWTEEFINEYKPKLPQAYQQNAYEYNLANLSFFKQDFGTAMMLLQKVEFTDVFYNLDSKSLLLKTYYELNEYEALFGFADTFNNYLRRNKKVSDYQKKTYMNMVRYTQKLAKLKINRKPLKESVKTNILNTQEIADSTWLRSKLSEFAN